MTFVFIFQFVLVVAIWQQSYPLQVQNHLVAVIPATISSLAITMTLPTGPHTTHVIEISFLSNICRLTLFVFCS